MLKKFCSYLSSCIKILSNNLINLCVSFTISFTPGSSLLVVNCTSQKNISMYKMSQILNDINKEIPLDNVVWISNVIFTECYIVFYVLTILWHILPAMSIDFILNLARSKSM